jgi:hypothetical protein
MYFCDKRFLFFRLFSVRLRRDLVTVLIRSSSHAIRHVMSQFDDLDFSALSINREKSPPMRRLPSGWQGRSAGAGGGAACGAKTGVADASKSSHDISQQKLEAERERRRTLALGQLRNEKETQEEEKGNQQQPEQLPDPMSLDMATTQPEGVPIALLPAFVAMLDSDYGRPAVVMQGVVAIRKLVSVAQNPPVGQVIQAGAVPRLIALLARPDADAELLYEVCWALTNIASGTEEETRYVVELGAIPLMMQVARRQLDIPNGSIQLLEQVAWCIGNVAGTSTQVLDYLLHIDALAFLLRAVEFFAPQQQNVQQPDVGDWPGASRQAGAVGRSGAAGGADPCAALLP